MIVYDKDGNEVNVAHSVDAREMVASGAYSLEKVEAKKAPSGRKAKAK